MFTLESIIRDIWGATQELSDLINELNAFSEEKTFPTGAVEVAVISSIEIGQDIFKARYWKICSSNAIHELINLKKLKDSPISTKGFTAASMLYPESFLSLRKFDIVGFMIDEKDNLINVHRLTLFEAIEILQINQEVSEICDLLEQKSREEELLYEAEIERQCDEFQTEQDKIMFKCPSCGENSQATIVESSFQHDNDSYDLEFVTETTTCEYCGHEESVEYER